MKEKLKLLFLITLVIVNCAFYADCQKTTITEDFDALLVKCDNLRKQDQKQQVVECFEQAIKLNPESYSAHVSLANINYDLGKFNEAEIAIKKAIEISPKEGGTYWIYGEILQKKGELQKALKEYETAVSLDPNDYLFWLNLGMLQDKLNETDGAIVSFERVLDLKPNYTLALYYLGNMYYRKGNKDKSIEVFEKLFELSPEYEKAGREKVEEMKRERNMKNKTKAKAVGGE